MAFCCYNSNTFVIKNDKKTMIRTTSQTIRMEMPTNHQQRPTHLYPRILMHKAITLLLFAGTTRYLGCNSCLGTWHFAQSLPNCIAKTIRQSTTDHEYQWETNDNRCHHHRHHHHHCRWRKPRRGRAGLQGKGKKNAGRPPKRCLA